MPQKRMPIVDTGGQAGSTTGIMTESSLRSGAAVDVRRLATRDLVGARGLARTRCRAIAGGRAASPTDRATAADTAGAPEGAAAAVLNILHRVLICERVKQPAASRECRRRSGGESSRENDAQSQHKLSHDIRPSCDVVQPMAPPRNWIMRRRYEAGNISRPELANFQAACRDARHAGLARVLLNGHSYRPIRDRTQHLTRGFLQWRIWR